MKGRDLNSGKGAPSDRKSNFIHSSVDNVTQLDSEPSPSLHRLTYSDNRRSANIEVKKRFVPGKDWTFASHSHLWSAVLQPPDLLSFLFEVVRVLRVSCPPIRPVIRVGPSCLQWRHRAPLFLHHWIIVLSVSSPHNVLIACRQPTSLIVPPAYKSCIHPTTKKLSACVSAERTSYQDAALRSDGGLPTWKALRASELHAWRRLCVTSHQEHPALSRRARFLSLHVVSRVTAVTGGATAAVQPRKSWVCLSADNVPSGILLFTGFYNKIKDENENRNNQLVLLRESQNPAEERCLCTVGNRAAFF